jgi:hypothetical protein
MVARETFGVELPAGDAPRDAYSPVMAAFSFRTNSRSVREP